jgi:endonuclease YncB( thermonuclease family)
VRRLLVLALLACSLPGLAAGTRSYEGTVSHVSDGDSLWVRPLSGGPAHELRIEGIDAPELCQSDGAQAREALARMVLQQRVRVRTRAHDDYGRELAHVEWQGQDVGAWMVRRGHAWSYRYRRDAGPYAQDERLARQAGRGLWRQGTPMEPRQFRQSHGPCDRAQSHRATRSVGLLR